MKARQRGTGLTIALAVIAISGATGFIRLAPGDPADLHVAPARLVPDDAGWRDWVLYPPAATGGVRVMPGGAYALRIYGGTVPAELLQRLDAIALATPRTTRLAGSPRDGHISWVTRSRFWGFPDDTTAMAFQAGHMVQLQIVARQRFGRRDFGVNAARLSDWLGRL